MPKRKIRDIGIKGWLSGRPRSESAKKKPLRKRRPSINMRKSKPLNPIQEVAVRLIAKPKEEAIRKGDAFSAIALSTIEYKITDPKGSKKYWDKMLD